MSARCIVLAVVACAACDQIQPIDDTREGEIPPAVQDAFTRTCAMASCHDPTAPAGGIDLSPTGSGAIFELVGKDLPLVRIGDVAGSTMGLALLREPPVGILKMPLERSDTSLTDSAIIMAWIAGAEMPGMAIDGDSESSGP